MIKKIMITGSKGMLAYALKKELADYQLLEVDLPEYDLTNPDVVKEIFKVNEINFVFNLAAFTNVDLCETEQQTADAVNHLAIEYLAKECALKDIPLVSISTDYVFDGKGTSAYLEDESTNPQSAYGRTKLAGEQVLRDTLSKHFIIRTAWLYGPNGKNFADTIYQAAKKNDSLRVVSDQFGCPTYTIDLAKALRRFIDSNAYGTYHIVNSGQTSWYGFSKQIVPDKEIIAVSSDEYPRPAKRPGFSVLSTKKFELEFDFKMPQWQDAIRRYKDEYLR